MKFPKSTELKKTHRQKIEQLAQQVQQSSNRFQTLGETDAQAIAYVLLKRGNEKPSQTDIEDARVVVLAAKSKILTASTQLVDILEHIDTALLPTKKTPEFKPSPLGDKLSTTNLSFTPGTIAALSWKEHKIPLDRVEIIVGKVCLANTGENTSLISTLYTKIFLYMIYGGKYPYASMVTEAHMAKILTIRNDLSLPDKGALKENVLAHFTTDAAFQSDAGDMQQKIEIVFSGLDDVSEQFQEQAVAVA